MRCTYLCVISPVSHTLLLLYLFSLALVPRARKRAELDIYGHHRYHRMERIAKSIVSTAIPPRLTGREPISKLFACGSYPTQSELHSHEPSRITEYVSASIVAGLGFSSRDLLDTIN